ncbi:hypothetical protein BCU68_02575 [Vibrio sp. 10N.286.49.B3]|uniref:type 4a pilus biogenesis protein PilO n=1 Tax=Vibrio sp. 10N.286.49.B3 TaxID=1880855 RepID=UPI000C84A134|nr:type 4a pilus biogenesis protein PilO [Vibrio sp. 10N.286.49.B3]PMH46281.1 hypothetical protein BCU68_02575 [Vibrio sp. 10N.286.49.B3]
MISQDMFELDELIQWSPHRKWGLILVLSAALQLLGVWFYLLPKYEQLQDQQKKDQQLAVSISAWSKKNTDLQSSLTAFPILSDFYQQQLKALPIEQELSDLLSSINELGQANQLIFSRMDWGERSSSHHFYLLPLNIELEGHFHDIGSFFSAIARLPRIVSFDRVTWQRMSSDSSRLVVKIQANTYQLKVESSDE